MAPATWALVHQYVGAYCVVHTRTYTHMQYHDTFSQRTRGGDAVIGPCDNQHAVIRHGKPVSCPACTPIVGKGRHEYAYVRTRARIHTIAGSAELVLLLGKIYHLVANRYKGQRTLPGGRQHRSQRIRMYTAAGLLRTHTHTHTPSCTSFSTRRQYRSDMMYVECSITPMQGRTAADGDLDPGVAFVAGGPAWRNQS